MYPELYKLLTIDKKVGETIHLLKGWTDGWDNQNRVYVMNLLKENAVL